MSTVRPLFEGNSDIERTSPNDLVDAEQTSDITLHRFVRSIPPKMATWTDRAPTTEAAARPHRDCMQTTA
jgi:hypothetical protein